MSIADQLQQRIKGLYADYLGIKFVEASADEIRAEIQGRPELCTVPGMIHGGVVMGFADSLGGIATFLNLPPGARGTTTIESKTNFFRKLDSDKKLTAVCAPLHRGKTTQVWQTRILDHDGKLAALVTQTQLILM
jgi:1,4-dihydroxy-2-naphthoyl-CoA hydrolase